MMAQFFWSSCVGGRGRHWTKWRNLCLPETEGGLGFRLLEDLSLALFSKLWWNFQTKPSIWKDYMRNKYCKHAHANVVMWKVGAGGSQVWKKMLQARDFIEHQILWQVKGGSASVWHDNWTGLGDLYTITGDNVEWYDTYTSVNELIKYEEWDLTVLEDIFPHELVEHILQHIRPPSHRGEIDTPCWMLDAKGAFSVKTTWQYIRHKDEDNRIYKWIWTKGVPFKMAFLMWRSWKFKIPVDDRVRRWGVQGPSKCWCCERPNQETLAHVFLKSYTANRTWSYFCSFTGINTAGLNLRKVIMLWWGPDIKKDMKPYYRVVPCFVTWELWRRRNKMKHEGKKTSLPRPEMLKELDAYRTKMNVTKVIWEFPLTGWVKYNTDGASRGNPGLSSYAFCLRDDKGDIMYAEGKMIETTTNTVAEAKAILEACKHCNQSNHTRIII
ncbi:hypothetical protein RDI58_007840 [Solanum bulbocastanum]|uniref:RNase H type-1 domain-containing protein n=1 Tax=Solanum bulbocastanum TaxID=147425 RepID=A0AAN8U206_SOLBU